MNGRNATLEPTARGEKEMAGELAHRVSPGTLIRCEEPLARHTTLRVGGPADLYVEPGSERDLKKVLAFCDQLGLQFLVLGRGSNLLVRDGGFRGVVICLAHTCFSRIEITGRFLHCGAGARLKAVASAAKRSGLAGLEFLEGIPGSVGGALRMNAGAMGAAVFDFVDSVRLLDLKGEVCERRVTELAVTYRSCPTLKTHIALAAVLGSQPGSREAITQRMSEYSRRRWNSQPAAPSAGCIFKNTGSLPAGKLIDELGLKGMRVGGAMVSAEHGNFIINTGTATARDILELIEIVRQRARAGRGVELETEVQIIGE
jgi:UDP-N-acetylenolpyruvoylglucosamine reductase